jgi:NAD(P)-dependent dehydrogenase (short-subunit alcohol dehydrogenase family)
MQSLFSLADRVAIVTGAASGIGRATAERLARAGARVVAADRRPVAWDSSRVLARSVVVDVAKEREVAAVIEQAAEELGSLDILVSNAGTFSSEPVDRMTGAALRRNMSVNFEGVVWGIKHAAGVMTAGGAIVNTASHAGLRGVPDYGAYAASKAAVIAYTKTAALELAARGIRVNCVCPGTVDTAMSASGSARVETATASLLQPLGRLARPEEIAATIHFLVSNDCAFITGQAVAVDGGKTAGPAAAVLEALSHPLIEAANA